MNWRAACSQFRMLPPGSRWAPGDASHLTCAPPAALASCAAARRVQDCNPRPPVLVRQRPRLTGRQLSARRWRQCPCQTTAFCWHLNTLFGRAAVLETGPLPPQDHKSGTVCRPISDYVGCQTVTEEFYSDSAAQFELLLTAPNRNTY